MFRKETGKNWLTNRVINEWNKLSNYTDEANITDCLKWRQDSYGDGEGR